MRHTDEEGRRFYELRDVKIFFRRIGAFVLGAVVGPFIAVLFAVAVIWLTGVIG